MSILQDSWSNFSADIAQRYLKTFGSPSLESKILLSDILHGLSKSEPLRLIELGCGNGHLAGYFRERGGRFSYTGVDFSQPLLQAGRTAFAGDPDVSFIHDDVHSLSAVEGTYDVAVYSHVIEMLESPETSLKNARRLAKCIIIRFFEPPDADETVVELRNLDTGDATGLPSPYIRWKMGRDFYRLMLSKLGATRVDIYRTNSKDQVHVLHFE